jgi:type VI secretion system protein VasG
MNPVDLRALVSKLDSSSRIALESAINNCLSQTHYYIELSHWLITLLGDPNNDISVIIKKSGVDLAELLAPIKKILSELKTGNTQTPAFSPALVECLSEAWSAASIEFNAAQINSGHVLYTLLKHPDLRLRLLNISQLFESISAEAIHDAILNLPSSEKLTAPAQTKSLDQFTVNLTERAKAGKLDDVIGRDAEIRQMIDVLTRRRQNNPILVGEAGVGKTAIAEGLAILIANNKVPDLLKNSELRTLDLALLQAGASIKGEFENRLKSVIHDINTSAKKIILFIDEAHTLIGAGNQAGQGDAANLLKPALARGELRVIAATTSAEYKKYFEKDAALSRRFQLIKIDEPDEKTTLDILRHLATKLESYHHVPILDEALTAAVYLSKRYIPDRQLPDKAVSLLDTACARVHVHANSTPHVIEDLENSLVQLNIQATRLQKELLLGEDCAEKLDGITQHKKIIQKKLAVLNKKFQSELKLYNLLQKTGELLKNNPNPKSIPSLQKKYKTIQKKLIAFQGDQPFLPFNINAQVISDIIENWTGIPTGKINSNEHDTLLNLEKNLKARIVGQDHAIDLISKSLQISRSNLADPHKPVGVFLLSGSSGVGKTETALALADIFYGTENALITINMSEYKEAHKISLLTGSPPGYVGYGEGGVLTEAVRRRPYSIVLLDEMEKAHPSIQDLFYQVFDKAVLMDGDGHRVDFSHTIILMTTNASAEIIPQTFKPAFLGRITVIPYNNLNDDMLKRITELQLLKIQKRVENNYGIKLDFSPELKHKIIAQCQLSNIGARYIEKIINHEILPILSHQFLAQKNTDKKIGDIVMGVDKSEQYFAKEV